MLKMPAMVHDGLQAGAENDIMVPKVNEHSTLGIWRVQPLPVALGRTTYGTVCTPYYLKQGVHMLVLF